MSPEIPAGADDGFGPVADAFAANFTNSGAGGPAFGDTTYQVGLGYFNNRMGGIGDAHYPVDRCGPIEPS
jgi:hypothetical protein